MVTSCQKVVKHLKSPRHTDQDDVDIEDKEKGTNRFDVVWRAAACLGPVKDWSYR